MISLRLWLMGFVTLLMAGTAVWVRAQIADDRPVASLLPAGALLYLEAKDFHRSLTEWNQSGEKKRWLVSKNFQELSVSRLIERLGQAADEFGAVSNVPVGMTFTDQVAGVRSGFAFYDLSRVVFVYLTQMPQNRMEATDLWRKRVDFQSREAAGVRFYVKADAKSGRKVSFASYKGWFAVATDEDRMAETLVLLSGGKAPSVASEDWFSSAAGAARKQGQTAGDLRLIYNLSALVQTPQFRTYWLHRNASELQPFSGGVADLMEQEDGFVEQRVMVRKSEAAGPDGTGASLAEAAAYAPAEGSSLVRAWRSPREMEIGEAVQQVLIGQKATHNGSFEPAPNVSPEAGAIGNEGDLEIRIDEPPFERASQQPITPLVEALVAMRPTALAHVQLTTVLRDQVFVLPRSGLVLLCQHPDRAALDRALGQVADGMQTGSLDPLLVSIEGQTVLLTRVPLARGSGAIAVGADVTYMASYNHAAEWPHYQKLFSVLDRSSGSTDPGISQRTPAFFSGNVASLGDTLSRLQRVSIVSSDTGATVHETVRYQLANAAGSR